MVDIELSCINQNHLQTSMQSAQRPLARVVIASAMVQAS
jgi:hypothetical protein